MGGNIFSARRIDTEEYDSLCSEVLTKLHSIGRFGEIPISFANKEDHGDIDVCLMEPKIEMNQLLVLFDITTDDVSINGSTVSIKYRDFQIDFCYYPKEDFDTACAYMPYGDTSNMIGVICNQAFGMRYTHRGLTIPVKVKQEDVLGEVVISKDTRKIFEFVGLNYDTWEKGFNEEDEVFDWITKSPYFNKDFFAFESLNHQNRTRNKKRAMYARFVEWLKPQVVFKNNYVPSRNLTEHMWRSMVHFRNYNWIEDALVLIDGRKNQISANENWNASDIIHLTGLEGKELGECIKKWKDYIVSEDLDNSYFEYTLHMPKEIIETEFKSWYAQHN